MSFESPLVLGGHSFISQLGSDPPASEREQVAIVEACLDRGISWIDTTYQPERLALGRTLEALGRRAEATILAWSFFRDFAPEGPLGESEPYRPGHIDVILEQLRTDHVDGLVLIPTPDPDQDLRQQELASEWRHKGYVRWLALWIPDSTAIERYRGGNSYRFAIRPFNVATAADAPLFAACRQAGWETLATSPFHRGWELDRMVAAAAAQGWGDAQALRPTLADLMLRFTLFQGCVDRTAVAMRRVEWVAPNLASAARGPLTADELRRLERLHRAASRKPGWWRRRRGRP